MSGLSALFAMVAVRWEAKGNWQCFVGWHDFPFRWKRLEPETCKCRRCDAPFLKPSRKE